MTRAKRRLSIEHPPPRRFTPADFPSATPTNAFELVREQLVALVRCRLDISVVAVATATTELRPMPGEAAAKTMSAPAGLGGSHEGRQERGYRESRNDL